LLVGVAEIIPHKVFQIKPGILFFGNKRKIKVGFSKGFVINESFVL